MTTHTDNPVLIEVRDADGLYLDRFYGRFATPSDTNECDVFGTVPIYQGTVIGVFASEPNNIVHVTPDTILASTPTSPSEIAAQYTLYPHPSTKVGLTDGQKYQIICQAHANKWVYNP